MVGCDVVSFGVGVLGLDGILEGDTVGGGDLVVSLDGPCFFCIFCMVSFMARPSGTLNLTNSFSNSASLLTDLRYSEHNHLSSTDTNKWQTMLSWQNFLFLLRHPAPTWIEFEAAW